MSALPQIVKKYLTQHNVVTHEAVVNSTDVRVEVVLLEDPLGKVQVFFPANRLLDLNKLRQILGRDLRSVTNKDLKHLLDRAGLSTIPAFDQLLNFETIVDQRLLDYKWLTLNSGNYDEFFKISDPRFLTLNETTRVESISTEIPEDLQIYEDFLSKDQAEINSSLSSLTSLRIQKRLQETLEIPPLPQTAKDIINLRSDPDADVEKLSKIVSQDPSLAAQVVSWASSSYYSAPGSVRSIQDAIFRVLGYDLVMNLALGLSLGKTLNMPKDSPEGFASYWKESVYVAATQAALLNLIPRELRPQFGLAYLSGLLHNFGNLILAHAFPPHYEQFCRLQEVNLHLAPQKIELHLLGVSRDQIAATLLKGWNLPDEVIHGVRYQNAPYYQGIYFDFAQLNYLSLALLANNNILKGPRVEIDSQLYKGLHIDPELVPEVIQKIKDSTAELDVIVGNLSGN